MPCLAIRLRYPVLTGLVCPGQTFEGGISGSPGVEAHGAYAFCALACLSILGPPEEMIPRYESVSLLGVGPFKLTLVKAYGSAPAPVMAIGSTVCPGGRLLRENE